MSTHDQVAAQAIPRHLVLHVRYLAAARPYVDPQASPTETLSAAKPRILDFFKLSEAPTPQGGKVYTFVKDGVAITDLSVMLGDLAEGRHELKFDLVEQLVQG